MCSSLTKHGAGERYIPLADSVSQGVHSSDPGLSWSTQNVLHIFLGHCFTSCVEKQRTPWSI